MSDAHTVDARLIAAAPDMLAALQAILDFEKNPNISRWAGIMERAEAAVSKATEVQP